MLEAQGEKLEEALAQLKSKTEDAEGKQEAVAGPPAFPVAANARESEAATAININYRVAATEDEIQREIAEAYARMGLRPRHA